MILKKINWNTIYQNQSPELMKLCLRYVQDKNQAEDLLHDAFLIAIDKTGTYKNIGSFNGWLKKIVLNTVLQHLRQNKKWEISQEYDDNILQKSNQTDAVVNKKYIIAQADFSKDEIIETLNILPEHHRIVFNLYVFEGYKHAQISKMLGISVGTSKSCLSRARKN